MINTAKAILIVDDRPNWRHLLRTVFESSEGEYITQTAGSPTEAISLLDQHNFGLVITNLGLEPMRGGYDRSGLKVVDKLQEQSPGTPCIVFTAFDEIVQEQVENYCTRYDAPIWVMRKWGSNVYKDLIEKVRLIFGEMPEEFQSIGEDNH